MTRWETETEQSERGYIGGVARYVFLNLFTLLLILFSFTHSVGEWAFFLSYSFYLLTLKFHHLYSRKVRNSRFTSWIRMGRRRKWEGGRKGDRSVPSPSRQHCMQKFSFQLLPLLLRCPCRVTSRCCFFNSYPISSILWFNSIVFWN